MKPIYDENIKLRFFKQEDAEDVRRLADHPDLAQMIGLPHPYLLSYAEAWICSQPEAIKKGSEYPHAITYGKHLAGTITLRIDRSNNIGELGYWIGREYWGKGIATEAVRQMIRFGFVELSLHKVHASVLSKNPGSQRVLEKAGLSREGVRKEHRLLHGVHEDTILYGLLKSEYHRLGN